MIDDLGEDDVEEADEEDEEVSDKSSGEIDDVLFESMPPDFSLMHDGGATRVTDGGV